MFARLLPFVYNSRDALVLVFKDRVMNVVQGGAPILSAGSPYGIETPYLEADLPRLSYVQAGNVVTLVHPSYPPYELTRVANDNWTLALVAFGATVQPPTLPVLSAYAASIDEDLFGWLYVITSVGADGEESLESAFVEVTSAAHHNHPLVVSWTAPVAGAQSYRIYRRPPKQSGQPVGAYGLAGVSSSAQFVDYARDPDFAQQPPIGKTVFAAADDYPSAVGYWQQRRIFANTNNHPDTVWASQIGRPNNFNISVPVKDDDAVQFRLLSDTVDEIRHIFTQGELTLFTEGGEWAIFGDQNGALTPAAINPRRASSHGVGTVRPVAASGGLLFPQALGSTVLGLNETASAQYSGTTAQDLTLFSTHLFDGHQITDMAWQQETPHVAWFVREDGTLLGLTYIPDQSVLAWHRHDMDGAIETVCAIPELVGSRIEHRVYCVVGRARGATVTHTIECFVSPFNDAVEEEAWFVDGGVEYDGRATLLPVSSVSGLDHLEGRDVAIYAFSKVVAGTPDGKSYILANPLRDDLGAVAVAGGSITVADQYLRLVVGLPFIADLETLDIDSSEGSTTKTQKTNIGRVGMQLLNSRNIWAGGALPDDASPIALMDPLVLATDADADTLITDFVEVNTRAQWETNGRIALRSIDPTPFTILSAVPQGYLPNPQEG